MNIKQIYNSQVVNILIAILIGLFIIFPDIIRSFDQHSPSEIENSEMVPEMNQGMPPFGDPSKPMEWNKPPEKHMQQEPVVIGEKVFEPILFDFLYFFFLSWGLLLINNPKKQERKRGFLISLSKAHDVVSIIVAFVITYFAIFLYSFLKTGGFHHFNPLPWYLDGILIFKGMFVFLSVVLFGQLFNLLYKQQNMVIENERLKNESLQNRFEALTAQISPHFFFNSLNSLSGLVREEENQKALKYINEMSNLFRYVLQGKWNELVSLKEEMRFVDAYRYLLSIRYEDKLIFDVGIDSDVENQMLLPALSLQPLIENIIKHNIISEEQPMTIKIFIRDKNTLVVQNRYQQKEESSSTGFGLSNLQKRYKYLTEKSIKSYIQDGNFIVELPLC